MTGDRRDRLARRLADLSSRLGRKGRRLARFVGGRARTRGASFTAASRRTAVRASQATVGASRRAAHGVGVVSRKGSVRAASTARRLSAAAERRGREPHARRASSPRRRPASILLLGLPLSLLLAALAIAAIIGLLLSYALVLTTQPGNVGGNGGINDTSTSGNNPSKLTVLTESTLGPEVQHLVDSGYVDSAATFDVSRCLEQQGVDAPVLIMEEVAWGPTMRQSWLIVHTPASAATLRAEGGAVGVSIVLPTCGDDGADDASSDVLWSGSALLSATTS